MIEVVCFGFGMVFGIFLGVCGLAMLVVSLHEEPKPAPPGQHSVLPDVNVRPYTPPLGDLLIIWQDKERIK